jgi:hypothetical protein
MGSRSRFTCTNKDCGYEATVSGKADRGMHSFTQTYVCRDCEILQDILIGEQIEDSPEREIKELELRMIPMPVQTRFQKFKALFRTDHKFKKRMEEYYQSIKLPIEYYVNFVPKEDLCCKICHGKNIEIWDEHLEYNEKHCPKCFNKMKDTCPWAESWD